MQTFREIVPTLRGNMKKRRKMPRNGWHFPFSFLRHRVRAQKPNSLALRAGVREPNRGPGSISLFSRHKVRAQKPNSLALRAGVREPPRGPGRFFAFFRLRVRARKPSSLALRADVREPCRRPGSISPFSRLKVRAQKPNSLALRAGEREPCAPCRSPGLRQIPCTKKRKQRFQNRNRCSLYLGD